MDPAETNARLFQSLESTSLPHFFTEVYYAPQKRRRAAQHKEQHGTPPAPLGFCRKLPLMNGDGRWRFSAVH